MSCDDWCKLRFDSTAFDAANTATYAPNPSEISTSAHPGDWREYYHADNSAEKVTSDWLTGLVAGKFYYMELTHAEQGGSDYLTVAVEYKDASPSTTHPNRKRAEHTLAITNPGDLETWTLAISNWDTDKKFKVNFKNDANDEEAKTWQSPEILADCTAA